MRRLLGCVLFSLVALPLAARADGSFQLNARAGLALPLGDTANGQQITDYAQWAFPLDAQLLFRPARQWGIGVYGRWSPTLPASGCSGCTTTDSGLGIVGERRFSEKAESGWIALSAGWTQLRTEVPTALGKVSTKLTGFEAAFAGGVDYEVGPITVGPYGQLSFGEYTDLASGGKSGSPYSKGVHAFLQGGVRAVLVL